MAKCKYQKREHQVSNDGGITWITDEVIKGDLIEYGSADCPESGSQITKWVTLDNDFICDGKNKYKKQVLYVSYDDGATWYLYFPTVYRKGEYIGIDEAFCYNKVENHYEMSGETSVGGHYHYDPVKVVKCSDSTTLTLNDVRYYDYEQLASGGTIFITQTKIINCSIGDCVTSIDDYVFSGATSLTSVTIPNSVTSIGDGVFSGCTNLSAITVQNSVTSMGKRVFWDCSSLSSFAIPSAITSITESMFCGCSSLASVNMPNGVTSIDWQAFRDCSSLTSITIPSGVTSIGRLAFYNCSSLTSIDIPSGVTTIDSCFAACSSLTSVTIPNSVTNIGESTFNGCSSLTSITIPSGVTSIGRSTFENCTSLTDITIPKGVTSIALRAFNNCTSLSSIIIPNNISSIGDFAFENCSGLTSITVLNPTPPTLRYNALRNTNDCPIYVASGSVETFKSASGWSDYSDRIFAIPLSPTIYDWSATTDSYICSGTTKYQELYEIQSNDRGATWSLVEPPVSGIGEVIQYESIDCGYMPPSNIKLVVRYSDNTTYSAECNSNSTLTSGDTKPNGYTYSAMTQAVIGNCVTSIGINAFLYFGSLTSVTIPNSVTSIGDEAFVCCSGLTSLNIPSGVTSIGEGAFFMCEALSSMTVNAVTPPTLGNYALWETNILKIFVPNESIDLYKTANGWASYKNRIMGITPVQSGGTKFYAEYSDRTSYYEECNGSTSLTTATTRPSGYNYTAMTYAVVGDCITRIYDYAFYGCSSLTSVTIPSGVTSIGDVAFFNCSSLTSITINAINPPTLGGGALYNTNDCIIYVPAASVSAYQSAWTDYASRIQAIP